MFKKSADERLTSWVEHRRILEGSEDPFTDSWEFWKQAPYIPYNNKIDPYFQRSWPTPWQIIVDNQYDDFTKALMIGWTLKMVNKFHDSKIEIRTIVDKNKSKVYNVVVVDDKTAINYNDNGPVSADKISNSFLLENLIELKRPR